MKLCSVINHKYKYFITQDTPERNFRVCIFCSKIQEYKDLPFNQKVWVSLVQRTNEGAKNWLNENPEIKAYFQVDKGGNL